MVLNYWSQMGSFKRILTLESYPGTTASESLEVGHGDKYF